MTRIPSDVRDMIEQAIYLPMAVSIFNRDLAVIQQSPFKLHRPYLSIVEESLKLAQKDLADVKRELQNETLKFIRSNETKHSLFIPLFTTDMKKNTIILILEFETKYLKLWNYIYLNQKRQISKKHTNINISAHLIKKNKFN